MHYKSETKIAYIFVHHKTQDKTIDIVNITSFQSQNYKPMIYTDKEP